MTRSTHAAILSAAEAYTAETGVTVESVSRPFDSMSQDYETQVPAGSGPDLIIGFANTLPRWVNSGIAAPLELGDALAGYAGPAQAGAQVDGTTYMVPLWVENVALIRNTDLVPEAPATMEELAQIGQELKDAGTTEYVISSGFGQNGNWYNLYALQASAGGPWFGLNEDGSYDLSDMQFDSEGGFAFADLLAEWGEAGVLDPDIGFDIAVALFTEGRAPFMITGAWDIPGIQAGGVNYAVGPIPTAGDQAAAPMVGVGGLILNPRSDCALAAADFATRFMTQPENAFSVYEDGAYVPALTAAADMITDDPDVFGFAEAGKDGTPLFSDPAVFEAFQPILPQTEVAILRGEGDPATLWGDMAEQVRAAMAEAGY